MTSRPAPYAQRCISVDVGGVTASWPLLSLSGCNQGNDHQHPSKPTHLANLISYVFTTAPSHMAENSGQEEKAIAFLTVTQWHASGVMALQNGWRWLQPWLKVSQRVKCQRLCKVREGEVVEGDVAHAPLVIHSLTCGKQIGNGNFSKCKYTLVKNMVCLMHTTCSSLAQPALFWQEERLRNKGRGRYWEILRGGIQETGWVVNVAWRL